MLIAMLRGRLVAVTGGEQGQCLRDVGLAGRGRRCLWPLEQVKTGRGSIDGQDFARHLTGRARTCARWRSGTGSTGKGIWGCFGEPRFGVKDPHRRAVGVRRAGRPGLGFALVTGGSVRLTNVSCRACPARWMRPAIDRWNYRSSAPD